MVSFSPTASVCLTTAGWPRFSPIVTLGSYLMLLINVSAATTCKSVSPSLEMTIWVVITSAGSSAVSNDTVGLALYCIAVKSRPAIAIPKPSAHSTFFQKDDVGGDNDFPACGVDSRLSRISFGGLPFIGAQF